MPRSPILDVILDPSKTLTSFDYALKNIGRKDLKYVPEVHEDFGSNGF